jgi:TRAP-type C4-dicarboxylate transport system substrate-binding protein
MKRTGFLFLCAALALHAAPAAAKTIKMGTLAPEGTAIYDILRDMGDAWNRASGGELHLKIYPGGIAGDESDMVRKIRIGQLQAGAISGGGLADIAPDIRALQMPMMFRSFEELDYCRAGVADRIEAAFEANDFKVLAWGDVGWLYFFTQQPVVHPDDLKRLKLFSWAGNTTFLEAWKALGYQPVPMAATELHLGLASGLIGAMAVPPIAALSFQWFGQAKHMTDLKFVPLVGAVVVSKRTWDSLPDSLKPAIQSAAAEAGRRFKDAREIGNEAIEVMQKHGLVVHPVPDDLVQVWEDRARIGWPYIVGTAVPADLVAEIERRRDEYRTR